MKQLALFATLTIVSATSSAACPWSGGAFYWDKTAFKIDIVVNDGCTQATITSLGGAGFQEPDVPETFPLVRTNKGWEADVHGVSVLLEDSGKYFTVDGPALRRRLTAHRR